MQLLDLIVPVLDITADAGTAILTYYQQGNFEQRLKSDLTPVTSADIAANRLLTSRLQQLTPDIPVLSEEESDIPFALRRHWSRYWLIDPLDGTQEFIAGSGDFAVVVALIEDNQPVLGVVYHPVTKTWYYAAKSFGSWKKQGCNPAQPLHVATSSAEHSLTFVISRRQSKAKIATKLNPNYTISFVELGSAALKACLVAEGKVDAYLRLGPTGEWDTAAAQCIVEQAGGKITTLDFSSLSYNCRAALQNPSFIVTGSPAIPWADIVCGTLTS